MNTSLAWSPSAMTILIWPVLTCSPLVVVLMFTIVDSICAGTSAGVCKNKVASDGDSAIAAARWICFGLVFSTTLLVAGLFFVEHGERLFPRYLGAGGTEQSQRTSGEIPLNW